MNASREEYIAKGNFWGKFYGISKILYVAALIILEVVLMYQLSSWLRNLSTLVYAAMEMLGLVVVVALFSTDDSSSYQMRWILIILLLPVIGLLLYVAWGRVNTSKRERLYVEEVEKRILGEINTDEKVWEAFLSEYPGQERVARAMMNAGFSLFSDTQAEYHPLGEQHFEALYEALENAQRFIFLEYFIIAEGEVWDRVHDILARKAKCGVKVLLLYDDVGSLITLQSGFRRRMESDGICAKIFNPVNHYVQEFYLNYRNHQKITIVDGEIAFTGGVNLADEYANLYEKHGHWKDTGMMLRGEAVKAMTATFLIMWEMTSHERMSLKDFIDVAPVPERGYYLPIYDGPYNNPQNPIEDLYKNMILHSKRYCYITTPYLIIDSAMKDALRLCAAGGVDVRLVVPHIGDHWYVHMVTRSHYGSLLRAGVKIYEYTPGFIHAKMIVSDDISAVLGTVNMDFRSFYLHYENTVWMCGSSMVESIRDDILATMLMSEEITYESYLKRPVHIRAVQAALNMFAPLM